MSDLFDCGIDFRGRTLLDVGCNMGVVAYEIAKHEPASIHGVDIEKDFIHVARMIFCAVPVASRFDRLDLTQQAEVDRILNPSYDVVTFLAVYQHIRKRNGVDAAKRVADGLIARCGETFVLRTHEKLVPEIAEMAAKYHFSIKYSGKPYGGFDSVFHVFRKDQPAHAAVAELQPGRPS